MPRPAPKKRNSTTKPKKALEPKKPTKSKKSGKLNALAKPRADKVLSQSSDAGRMEPTPFDDEHRKARRKLNEQQLATCVDELSSTNEDAVISALRRIEAITRAPKLAAPIFWEHIPQLTAPQLLKICNLLKSQRETVQNAVLQFLFDNRFASEIVVSALLDVWSSLHAAQLTTAIKLIASCETDSVSEALNNVADGLLSDDIDVRIAAGNCLWKHHDELAPTLPALLASLRKIKDDDSRDRAVLVTIKYFESINNPVECARQLLKVMNRKLLTNSLRRLQSEGQALRRLIDENDGWFPRGKPIEGLTVTEAGFRKFREFQGKDEKRNARQKMERFMEKNTESYREKDDGSYVFDSAIFPNHGDLVVDLDVQRRAHPPSSQPSS